MQPLLSKLTPQKMSRLVEVAFDKNNHLRKARTRFLAQYTGRFYSKSKPGDAEERKASPINLIYQAVTTMVPNLAFRDPKFKVRSQTLAYRGYADMLELATNHLTNVLKLRKELRMTIVDALFFAGFMKTGIATTGQFITQEDQDIAIGEPFAERVDPDDMILDPLAKQWEEQMIIGNRFRVLRQDLLDSGLYDNDLVMNMGSRTDSKTQFEAQYLSGDKTSDLKEVMDFVDLVEVFIPRDQRVVTMPWTKGQISDQFLRDVDWAGPETGPYHMLGFNFVPDNLLPIPPVSLWYDLHVLGNRIARKIARQADRMKRVLAYEGSAIADAENIADADDGETVRVNNLGAIKEVTYGGTTDEAYEFMKWTKGEFSDITNNLDMLSGNEAGAPTATQSEMLQNNSSVRLSDIQNMVYDFTQDIGTDLAFFLHTDPLIELPLIKRVSGQDTQVTYTPDMREGEFMSYMLAVEPQSMARPDPNMKVQHLLTFASNVIPAAAQAAQMLGPAFKVGAFLSRVGEEIGLEEMDEIIDMPTYRQWAMAKLANDLDAGSAQAFAINPQFPSMPWDQGGQQAFEQQQMQQQIQSLMAAKAQQQQAGQAPGQGGGGGGQPPQPPQVNTGQPNPGQQGPSPQNVSAGTAQASAQQQVAGQLRKAYPTSSAFDRSQVRG
jgi:hypothetical protein